MSVETELTDEILDTPTMAASTCARCFVCVCVGINDDAKETLDIVKNAPRLDRTDVSDVSDESLDGPTQEASTCAPCFVCVCVGIGDETLEAPAAS